MLIQMRRTLLSHIGALLAEREQIGTRIRVSISLSSGLAPCCMRSQSPSLADAACWRGGEAGPDGTRIRVRRRIRLPGHALHASFDTSIAALRVY